MGAGGVNYRYKPTTFFEYHIKPHYKLFPFKWYDLWQEEWRTDGTHVPFSIKTLLAERQTLTVVNGMKKLVKD